MARWNSSNQILRYPLCCAIGERSPRSKNTRRSRSCKERNEAQKKFSSGRSGFIGDAAERFAGPFVTLRRSRTQDSARVEQLRGHTAKNPPNLLDLALRIFEIFALVCRRRWPSGWRPQAPQRRSGFESGEGWILRGGRGWIRRQKGLGASQSKVFHELRAGAQL
jgi:hypothetical protein